MILLPGSVIFCPACLQVVKTYLIRRETIGRRRNRSLNRHKSPNLSVTIVSIRPFDPSPAELSEAIKSRYGSIFGFSSPPSPAMTGMAIGHRQDVGFIGDNQRYFKLNLVSKGFLRRHCNRNVFLNPPRSNKSLWTLRLLLTE